MGAMLGATPRRVVVLAHTGALSGGEIALTRLLAAIDRIQITVVVVLFADGPLADTLRDLGVEVRLLPLTSNIGRAQRHALLNSRSVLAIPRAITFVVRLGRLLRALEPEVVHANSLKAGVLGVFACRLARRPLVWYVHDRISSDYLPAPAAALVRGTVRRGSSVVLANSTATMQTLRLPAQVPSFVAYPGLPASAFVVDLAPASPPVVGMVGRISPTKGQAVFLRAARQVHDTHPDVRFVVVGSALFAEQQYEQGLHTLAAELGICEAVRFTGQLADPAAELSTFSLLIHASPTPEPFGQVIVEAMAAGVPVVATRGGGVDEVVGDDNQCALTVPPNDAMSLAAAISDALDDPAAAAARASRAKTRAGEMFRIDQTVEAVTGAWRRAQVK